MYKTLDGRVVKIIEDTYDRWPEGSHSRCVRGSDGSWRYGHSGRVTGSKPDYPQNIMHIEVLKMPLKDRSYNLGRRIGRKLLGFWRFFFCDIEGIFMDSYNFKKLFKRKATWQK
jgi:hypothetical protein